MKYRILIGLLAILTASCEAPAQSRAITLDSSKALIWPTATEARTAFGIDAGVGAWLVTPSSANLAAAVTGETGSDALVFANRPTFTTSTTASTGVTISNTGTGATTGLNITTTGNASTGIFVTAPVGCQALHLSDGVSEVLDWTSGTLNTSGGVNAASFNGNGSAITNLNASNISSGVLAKTLGGTGVTELTAFSANKGGTDQTLTTPATFYDITFGTEVTDTANAFASSVFTAPATKTYLLALTMGGAQLSGRMLVQIHRNGSEYRRVFDQAIVTEFAFACCVLVDATAGDVFKVVAFSGPGSATIYGGSGQTTFSGKLLP